MSATLERQRRGHDEQPREPRGHRGSGAYRARWRVAARLARRQVRRTISSSVLIATLIALPIAGMAAFSVVVWSTVATPEESVRAELGQMQAWVQPVGVPDAGFWQAPTQPDWNGYPFEDNQMTIAEGDPLSDPISTLPSGTETIAVTEGQVRADTAAGVATLPAWAGEVWDERFQGSFDLIAGRAPATADEVLVTPAGLERFGITIGEDLTLVDSSKTFTVVGTMTAAATPSAQAALFLPSGALTGTTKWFLPEDALSWAKVQALNDQGVVAYSREVVLDPPRATASDEWGNFGSADGAVQGYVMMLAAAGLFAAYVVIMLAGAAFSVAARRQQRSLAVAASVGATASDLRRTIILQGTALGLAGGFVGLALGVGLAALIMWITDDGSATRYWGFHVPWAVLAGILIFSVLVGTASAAIPARTVARSDTLSALRGARRPQTPRASRPIWGSIILIAGVGITIASAVVTASLSAIPPADLRSDSPLRAIPPFGIVIGPILVQIGIILSGRWLLWLASRVLSRVSLAARLASRDAAANASRTVPAFAAIGATVFIAVFALSQSSMQIGNSTRNWFYQGPVGTLSVEFYPGGNGTVMPVTAEQADVSADSAVDLVTDAGASTAAVIRAQSDPGYYPSPEDVPAEDQWIMALMPEEHLLDPTAQASYRYSGQWPMNPISVIEPASLSAVLGVDLSPAQLSAFRSGSALVTDERWVTDGDIDVAAWAARESYEGRVPDNIWIRQPEQPEVAEPEWRESIEAVVVDVPDQPMAIAISPGTAERLGMVVQPVKVVAVPATPLETDDMDRLYAHADLLSTPEITFAPHYERGPSDDMFWMVPVLLGVAVLVLGASAVALGLARFERRPDDATLSAVGGTRGLRRRIGFWQGLIIAGFGTIAGAAAGVLPPIGFAIQSRGDLLVSDMPWPALTLLAIGLPLVIAAASWLIPPQTPELTRRTVIA
ncbi:ABC transporter permease [Microbacterium abyssi]|uniref:ABC transporter permease n=1 Tax=Microbacterium abyssi TaxID=2782166 RepID=UPI001887F24B|nr:ABC transporter permease [Microbacterium sp. A18JL241]